jgi:hypothetical protein
MPYLLARTFFVNIAYGLASFSSGLVVSLCTVILVDENATRSMPGIGQFLVTTFIIGVMIALYAGPWAAAVIVFGELKAIRRKRYYGVAGILIGLGVSLLFYTQNWFPYVGAGYGSVAGLIYWWVAGRTAGFVDPTDRQSNQSQLYGFCIVVGLSGLFAFYSGYRDLVESIFTHYSASPIMRG